jgi:hypothetical protein
MQWRIAKASVIGGTVLFTHTQAGSAAEPVKYDAVKKIMIINL